MSGGALFGCSEGGSPERIDAGTQLIVGDVLVKWDLVDADGQPRSCQDLGIADIWVALGGEPQTTACGDLQETRFRDRLAGVYPVVVRVRTISQSILQEQLGNVVVSDPGTTEYTATFTFDETVNDVGSLRARWRIRGEDADTGCAAVVAHQVRIQSQPGSIRNLDAVAPCTDGQIIQTELRPGNYVLRLLLLDSAGTVLSARQDSYQVMTVGRTEVDVNFTIDNREPAQLSARWTVSGTTASAGCESGADWTVRVRLSDSTSQDLEIATATAACELGAHRFDDLVAPAIPNLTRYRTRFFLQDPLRGTLTSTIVEDVRLEAATTTTVTVDLDPGL